MPDKCSQAPIISEDGTTVRITLTVDRMMYEYALARSKTMDGEFSVEDELGFLLSMSHEYVMRAWTPPDEIVAIYDAHFRALADRIRNQPRTPEVDDGIPW